MKKDLKQYNYDLYVKYYDLIELKPECVNSINIVLDRLLSFYRVKTVHDITCGTGAQVSFLASKGYNVSGSDISKAMLVPHLAR
jgi:2-polyprenyl-3-methyl-5-hydroxy-6-metoxy-1,4-benzoquinol methylase